MHESEVNTMAPNEVQDKLQAYFEDNFLYEETMDEIDKDKSLIDNGYIDSTGIIGLVSFLEKTFNIKVHDNEIIPENFDTLNNIYSYVGSKVENIRDCKSWRVG